MAKWLVYIQLLCEFESHLAHIWPFLFGVNMRLIYEQFESGKFSMFETDNTGGNKRVIKGDAPDAPHETGVCSLYIEVSCNDDMEDEVRQGLKQMSEHLAQLTTSEKA